MRARRLLLNHATITRWVRHQGEWLEVERQRMDAAIVIDHGRAICRKLRDLRAGDQVVCFLDGIRVVPEFRSAIAMASHS